jgi:hypothetical protein
MGHNVPPYVAAIRKIKCPSCDCAVDFSNACARCPHSYWVEHLFCRTKSEEPQAFATRFRKKDCAGCQPLTAEQMRTKSSGANAAVVP